MFTAVPWSTGTWWSAFVIIKSIFHITPSFIPPFFASVRFEVFQILCVAFLCSTHYTWICVWGCTHGIFSFFRLTNDILEKVLRPSWSNFIQDSQHFSLVLNRNCCSTTKATQVSKKRPQAIVLLAQVCRTSKRRKETLAPLRHIPLIIFITRHVFLLLPVRDCIKLAFSESLLDTFGQVLRSPSYPSHFLLFSTIHFPPILAAVFFFCLWSKKHDFSLVVFNCLQL